MTLIAAANILKKKLLAALNQMCSYRLPICCKKTEIVSSLSVPFAIKYFI